MDSQIAYNVIKPSLRNNIAKVRSGAIEAGRKHDIEGHVCVIGRCRYGPVLLLIGRNSCGLMVWIAHEAQPCSMHAARTLVVDVKDERA